MATQLIGPEGLEIDAVVPQCLDNQYVSDDVFRDMMTRGVDYQDESVEAAREQDFRTEFVRSLVYSSQVVIQRAYFKNSDFLYKNYLPEQRGNLIAFADLLRQRAIVPFLYRESSLTDQLTFDIRKEGDRATRALIEETGDEILCVRLAERDAANERATDAMSGYFSAGLTWLNNLNPQQRNAMASELFSDPTRVHADDAWPAFNKAVNDLAAYTFKTTGECRERGEQFTRTHVYEDTFIRPGGKVALGQFARISQDNRFLFELKKYVDLVYNTNLPDRLRRYTFTPGNLPSRMALQDAPNTEHTHDQISAVVSNDDGLEAIQRAFMAHTQNAMNLPLLSELTVADVVAIRLLPEWEDFKNTQRKILADPLGCLENMEDFQANFDAFQGALSNWYNRTYHRPRTEGQYCNYVTLAISIGGSLIVAGSDVNALMGVAGDTALGALATRIPQRVKGYAAKLMVGVYDRGARRLDADRSYTVELMQTQEELLRDDVLELLQSVSRKQNPLPEVDELMADQGSA